VLAVVGRLFGSAYGIRTRVTAVRGRRPGPLDECAEMAGRRKIPDGTAAVKAANLRRVRGIPGGRASLPGGRGAGSDRPGVPGGESLLAAADARSCWRRAGRGAAGRQGDGVAVALL
jgi:hypothetical protein